MFYGKYPSTIVNFHETFNVFLYLFFKFKFTNRLKIYMYLYNHAEQSSERL